MKKWFSILSLIFLFTGGFLFAQEAADDYSEIDDFDSVFDDSGNDIVVEQSEPVITATGSSGTSSILSFSGNLNADIGLALKIQEDFDFGGYFDMVNNLCMNVRPSSALSLHGALKTAFSNKFSLDLAYLYFDYMPFGNIFISAGKKDLTWGYTRLFTEGNIMDDSANKDGRQMLNAEVRCPWSFGTAVFAASYNYGLLAAGVTPGYKDITYALSIENTIVHTSLNIYGKWYGLSEVDADGNYKNPLAGLELKRTIADFDCYTQGTVFFDFSQGVDKVRAIGGFYRLWDGITPNFGINIEYLYEWDRSAIDNIPDTHTHRIILKAGLNRLGKNKNLKFGLEWNHNFTSKEGKVDAAFITGGLFPYASWKNGLTLEYNALENNVKAVIGSVISIALDY